MGGTTKKRASAYGLAVALIVGSAAIIPTSCTLEPGAPTLDDWLDEIDAKSARAREQLADHDANFGRAMTMDAIRAVEASDARAIGGTVVAIEDALYAVEWCSKEGTLGASAYVSEALGEFEFEVASHVETMSKQAWLGDAAVEENEFQARAAASLDALDAQLRRARAEATARKLRDKTCEAPPSGPPPTGTEAGSEPVTMLPDDCAVANGCSEESGEASCCSG